MYINKLYIGVDIGADGAASVVDGAGKYIDGINFKKGTVRDIKDFLTELYYNPDYECRALIESVHSSPQMGVSGAFSFGRSAGIIVGMLTAIGIPFDFVSPQKWQKTLGCMTHGDKNISKAKAQQLFPEVRITHSNADSLLIAEYLRRVN